MTVTAQSTLAGPFVPNGVTTAFPFTFKAASTSEVAVLRLLSGVWSVVDPSLYSVSLGTAEGGTVTLAAAPALASGDLYIVSDPSFAQEVSFGAEGPFTPRSLNGALDKAAIRDLVLKDRTDRSIRAPRGEAMDDLPSAVTRAGKFLAFDSVGDPLATSGTGSDAALRTDLAATNGDLLLGSRVSGLTDRAFRDAFRRYREARPTTSLSAEVALNATGKSELLNDSIASAAASFPGPVLYRITANDVTLGGGVFDAGNNAGSAWSGAGAQDGGIVFATGTNSTTRLSGLTLTEALYRNADNGAINIEYVDDGRAGWLRFQDCQRGGGGYNVAPNLTIYYGRRWAIGGLTSINYKGKAHAFDYVEDSVVGYSLTKGGAGNQADACVHIVGGYNLGFGPVVHNGDNGAGGKGYGLKAVDGRLVSVSYVQMRNAYEAVQVYGSHFETGWIDSEDHTGAAVSVDAYQSRDQSAGTEVRFLCHGPIRSYRGAAAGTAANALTLRGDNTYLTRFTGDGVTTAFTVGTSPSGFAWNVATATNLRAYVNGVLQSGGAIGNGVQSVVGNLVTLAAAPASGSTVVILDAARTAPTRLLRANSLYARGGFSGLYEVRTPMSQIDEISLPGGLDVDDLASGGYPLFAKAKTFDLGRLRIGPNVRNGIIAYTDAMNRGGWFRAAGCEPFTASSNWASEPLLRLGYPGTGDFSEAGFGSVLIEDFVSIDGNSNASFVAFDLLFHRVDAVRSIVLRNLRGRNMAHATPINIDLTGCTNVVLYLSHIDMRNAAGARRALNITNPGAIVGGYIDWRSCNIEIASASWPANVWPRRVRHTVDLSALADGATSADQSVTVTGAAIGDSLIVLPRNADHIPVEARISAANTAKFKVLNRSGAAGSATAAFDVIVERNPIT